MRQMSQAFVKVRIVAVVAAAALAASACADLVRASRLEPAGVNVESPAAGAVLAAQTRPTPFPGFRDVPPKVTDVRPAPAFAQAVASLHAERADFQRWQAQNPPETTDTREFAAGARDGVTQAGQAVPPSDQTARSAAWAKQARDAAKAPAPVSTPKP